MLIYFNSIHTNFVKFVNKKFIKKDNFLNIIILLLQNWID